MAIQTGTFDGLGISYEKGSDAALLSAMARSAEELTSGKGWPEGGQRPADRARTGHRGQPGVDISAPDTHITQNYTFEWAAAARYRAKHQSRNRLS